MRHVWPVAIAIGALFCARTAPAQVGPASSFFLDAVPFAGATVETSSLDLYVAVPYGIVSFEWSGHRFTAVYRVHIEVANGSRTAYDTTIERTATTRSAEVASAQHPAFDVFQHRVATSPGSYDVRVEIIDPRTSFVATARSAAIVADYRRTPLALSGLLLVDRIREDSSGFVITPRLTDAVSGDGTPYFLFFEAYNGSEPLELRFDAVYRPTDATRPVVTRTFERSIPAGRSQQWLRLDAADIARGAYTVELRATRSGDTTRVIASSARLVRVETGESGLPIGERELDERITQLRYVALQSELVEIRDGATYPEKRRRYAEFWKRHDPTPGTPTNEAMIEYFARIDYATEHFRSYSAGWMTDQGRIYVIYGPPDNVSRDPFRGDGRRIETWQYYSRGNLEIIFEDSSGFGDYRLATPISTLEKYRYGA
jgi:GWxTD domain-containing protein